MELSEKAKEVVAMYRNDGDKRSWGEIDSMSKEELQEYHDHCNAAIQRLYMLSVEHIYAIPDFPISEATCIMEDLAFLHSQSLVSLKMLNGLDLGDYYGESEDES